MFCLHETHLRTKDLHRLKVKDWKKVLQASGPEKEAEVAILTSSKIDFKTNTIKRDKGEHYIILKGIIH